MADEEPLEDTVTASHEDHEETTDKPEATTQVAKDNKDEVKTEGTDSTEAEDMTEEESALAALPMDKIEALLDSSADKRDMTPQMRRIAQRQAENSRRVEETVKGTKANPVWYVPLACILMIIGLIWAVVFYLTTGYPIKAIGNWNLAVAFAIIMVGFIMLMWWR
ncbi:septation inhibitor protein [Bifidobacterium aemilianum]|uniref:Cell division protein CrgA n=1 Tax=Bifidobacterium aemilianum TaxID=2493120 RepID=A0A366K7S5_9BIFI|nr:cell division protein CrgA [Bifidobacterium aemilianum]RBP97795.1 septation inhibitor protein [Bifidobacterium aemilianum]